MNIADLLPELLKGILHFTWGNAVMIATARVWLPVGKYSTGRNDRCGRYDGGALQRGHRHGVVPFINLCRCWRNDRFQPSARTAKNGVVGRGGTVRDIRHLTFGDCPWVSTQPGRFDRRDRRDRWSHIHFCGDKTCARASRTNCSCGIFLYESDSDHPAAADETSDNQKRTPDPNGIYSQTDLAKDPYLLPHRFNSGGG